MFTVTPQALEKMRVLNQGRHADGFFIRIQVVGASCSGYQYRMVFDQKDPQNDEIIELEGCQILVDSSSWVHLQATTLDYENTATNAGFKFIRSGSTDCQSCGGACK